MYLEKTINKITTKIKEIIENLKWNTWVLFPPKKAYAPVTRRTYPYPYTKN